MAKSTRTTRVPAALIIFTCLPNCSGSDEAKAPVTPVPAINADAGPSPAVNAEGGTTNDRPDGSTPPPPPPPPPKASVLVAAGHMARTVMSCDGGLTWINDQSQDDDARCWIQGPSYVECDHTPYSSPNGGLTYGDGWFYAAFGWGYAGSVRRSSDGKNWETVKTGGWGGGVAYAKQSLFVLWEGSWSTSPDRGTTWNLLTDSPRDNFDHASPRTVGDTIIVMGRAAGAQQSAVSSDGGLTWSTPTGLGATDGHSFASGNGVLVSAGSDGTSARSVDGGATWTTETVIDGGNWATNMLFDGTTFVALGDGKKWSSPDGVTWSSVPFKIDGVAPVAWWGGTAAYDPVAKSYVAILTEWNNYYDKQRAYRSTDGVTWTTLDATAFKGGHPLRTIVHGEIDPKACEVTP